MRDSDRRSKAEVGVQCLFTEIDPKSHKNVFEKIRQSRVYYQEYNIA